MVCKYRATARPFGWACFGCSYLLPLVCRKSGRRHYSVCTCIDQNKTITPLLSVLSVVRTFGLVLIVRPRALAVPFEVSYSVYWVFCLTLFLSLVCCLSGELAYLGDMIIRGRVFVG